MDSNSREPVPQAIQDVIQVTVDRAIATLIESGLLNGKLYNKKRDGKRRRSRSRSRSHSKKGKGRKRSSSSSSSSSSSDSDDEDKDNGKKGKGRKRSRSRGKGKGRGSSRSHSRGRHSRSRSKSRSKSRHHHHGHGKKGWLRHHHDSDGLLSLYHHYFNCPCAWAEGDESGGSRKGKKHGYRAHKKHWKKFRCPFTDDDDRKDKTKDDSDKETDLSKEFETLEVIDKDKEQSQ